MRILIAIDEFTESNGVSRVNENLANEWINRGHEVKILTFSYTNFTKLNVKIIKKFLFPDKENIKEIKDSINVFTPNIIFCNAGRIAYPISKEYFTFCRYAGSFPYDLLHTFLDGLKIFLGSLVLHIIQFLNIRNSNILIAPSKFMAKSNKVFFLRDFNYIYNGVSKKNVGGEVKKENHPSMVFIGEIRASKGVKFLVKLFKEVKKQIPEIKLHVIGKGNRKLIKLLKSEKGIVYHGKLKEPFDILQNSDVFAFPSYSESFGLSLLEAQSYGKPVVAFKTTAIPEVVNNNKSGFLVKKGNLKEFAEKTILLLNNKIIRRKMGQEGKKFAKKFSWEESAKKYLNLFESNKSKIYNNKNSEVCK